MVPCLRLKVFSLAPVKTMRRSAIKMCNFLKMLLPGLRTKEDGAWRSIIYQASW